MNSCMLVFVRMSVLKEICLNTWLSQHAAQYTLMHGVDHIAAYLRRHVMKITSQLFLLLFQKTRKFSQNQMSP